MKPVHLLPPAVSLAIAGVWLGMQERSITEVEEEITVLRRRVAAARLAEETGSDPSLAARSMEKGGTPAAMDWKELAGTLAANQAGGMPDLRAMVAIQNRLTSMSGQELIEALDAIEALKLTKSEREALERLLVEALAEKEPRLLLERYFDGASGESSGGIRWQLSRSFQKWAGSDRAAAIAWLDARIAEGEFDSRSLDGTNEVRLQFEAAAVAALLGADSDAARLRVSALPEGQRRSLLRNGWLMNLKPGSENAYANLVRETMPEEEHGQTLADGIKRMVGNSYEKAGAFLDEVKATPSERAEVAKSTARSTLESLARQGKVDRQAVDEMREWIARQAPAEVDRLTGEAFSNIWNQRWKWEDRAGLIGELHSENPSDELLVSFLGGDSQATQHREAALELAAKIADETKRAEAIARIGGGEVQPAE